MTAIASASRSRSARRVAFAPTATIDVIDCSLTPDERSSYHHTREDMARMSSEAKSLASSHRDALDGSGDFAVRLDADPSLRGMELHLFRIRAKNMVFGRRALLKYHRGLRGSSKSEEERVRSLAAAGARMSRWSRQVAAATARLDSLRAYWGDYLIPIGDPVAVDPHPCAPRKRRRVTCDGDDDGARRGDAGGDRRPMPMPIEAARASFAKRRRVSFDEDS